MRIFNIMLDRSNDLSRFFVNYARILSDSNQVFNIISRGSHFADAIPDSIKLPNLCPFDVFSILKLRNIIKLYDPHIILAHDERAAQFGYYSRNKKVMLVGIASSESLRYRAKCDYVIATTKKINDLLLEKYLLPEHKVIYIPSMIKVSLENNARLLDQDPIIGVISNFGSDSGIQLFLNAMNVLLNKYRNLKFKVIIGVHEDSHNKGLNEVKKHNLESIVSIVTIRNNKSSFFEKVDIFCSPSLNNNQIDIDLLQAMHYTKPIVATHTFIHSEYIDDMSNGLLCSTKDPSDMVSKIELLINDQMFASKIANQAYITLQKDYSISAISAKVNKFLHEIIFDQESIA